MSLSVWAEEFIEQGRYLRGWSPKTIRTYRQSLALLNTAGVSSLSREELQNFVLWMRKRGLTSGGMNVRIRTVNAFTSWLEEEGRIRDRVGLRLLPAPPKVLVTFSDAEVRRIVARRPADRNTLRAWTLFVTLADTGLRIEEALTLERERVDLDALTITVVGKGGRERIVPMSNECRKALFRLTAKQTDRYVFATANDQRMSYRNAYRDLKSLCRRVGVQGSHVRPHSIRHFFAVSYVRNGGDIYRLSRILGHSSISTTQIYLRSMGIEHLQEGHAKFSPLARLV